jgi:hypothetical protein
MLTVSPTVQTTQLIDSIKQQTKNNNKTTKNKQQKTNENRNSISNASQIQIKCRIKLPHGIVILSKL